MREIKFRAWNVATKTMIDLKKMTPLALNMDTDGLFIPFSDGLIIEQFTGLTDKAGREIYEGDWARLPFFWRYNEGGVAFEEEGYYEGQIVIIASAGVCIRNPLRHKYNLTNETPEEICKLKQYRRISAYITEVIGNIHEEAPHDPS